MAARRGRDAEHGTTGGAMMAVIFELEPQPGAVARYFELAAELKASLERIDGFISVERFESLARPGRFLSLSFWRDETAIRHWRCHGMHRQAQQEGRSQVLAGYRLRVATVVRDYAMTEREQVPADSRMALV
jgi:heme-degrading monooxygenase HmoA